MKSSFPPGRILIPRGVGCNPTAAHESLWVIDVCCCSGVSAVRFLFFRGCVGVNCFIKLFTILLYLSSSPSSRFFDKSDIELESILMSSALLVWQLVILILTSYT